MATKSISEDAFKAGFKHGYANGRAGQLAQSDIENNAEAAYQLWWKEQQESTPHAFAGAVIPVTGVNPVKK